MKKCQQSVNDHKAYADKYCELNEFLSKLESQSNKCLDSIAGSSSQNEWNDNLVYFKKILDSKPFASALMNSALELGEKTYSTTSIEGRETIRNALEEAQNRLDTLFDSVIKTERDIESKLTKYQLFLFSTLCTFFQTD